MRNPTPANEREQNALHPTPEFQCFVLRMSALKITPNTRTLRYRVHPMTLATAPHISHSVSYSKLSRVTEFKRACPSCVPAQVFYVVRARAVAQRVRVRARETVNLQSKSECIPRRA